MDFYKLLPIAFERSNQLQTYWNFYATVVLALLAFFGSAKADTRSIFLATVVTLAFVGVSVANLEALCDVTRQRLEIQSALRQAAANDQEQLSIVRSITPSSLMAVKRLHYIFDASTVIALWVLTLRCFVNACVKPNWI